MIVLDEQLLGRGIEATIARWYPGAVRFITDLRPGTIIKDEAITSRFCIVCIAFPDSRAAEIPAMLQVLLRHPAFQTKAQRMGKVIRITSSGITYYASNDNTVHTIA